MAGGCGIGAKIISLFIIIEILWRFIKYQWMEIDAYESWSSLVNAVENIFVKFGTEYIINFA
jgi:hypothetical protein